MDSLKVGIAINRMLLDNPLIVDKVQNKVFPIVSESDIDFPFIVYRRSSLFPKYVKFGNVEDEITIEIIALSSNYADSVEIAQLIRDTLEYKEIESFTVTLSDACESYGEGDAYAQTLTFKLINN